MHSCTTSCILRVYVEASRKPSTLDREFKLHAHFLDLHYPWAYRHIIIIFRNNNGDLFCMGNRDSTEDCDYGPNTFPRGL